MSLCKTSDPWSGAIFDPRAIIWIILVDVHKIKLHTNIKGLGLSFRQDFSSFAYRSLCKKKIYLSVKKVKVNPRLSFFQTLLGPCPQCCIPSPRATDPLVLQFYRVFTIYRHWGHLDDVTHMWLTFVPLAHGRSIWNLALICPVVSEKKMSEACGRLMMMDGRQQTEGLRSLPIL